MTLQGTALATLKTLQTITEKSVNSQNHNRSNLKCICFLIPERVAVGPHGVRRLMSETVWSATGNRRLSFAGVVNVYE